MTKYAQQARATKKKRKVFKYDDKKTRGRNVVNRVVTAPQNFEAKIRNKQALKKQYQKDFQEYKASGGKPLNFEREFGSFTAGTYKGTTSIVDKKPKKRGTPK